MKNLARALAVAGVLAAPVQAQDASTVVATVNGVEITLGHMIVAMSSLPEQYQQLPNEVLFEGIMDQLIQQSALVQAFEGDLPPFVQLSLDNEARALTAQHQIEVIAGQAVTPERVQAAYDSAYGDQDPGKEYNASHILLESEEEAQRVRERLDGGAGFAAMAREFSTGPSGPGGGELGWFGPGMMVEPFFDAVTALEDGQVSDPVQTQFGWHIIKLNETRLRNVPELNEVRAELEEQVRRDVLEEEIERLVSSSIVEKDIAGDLDPAVLRNMDLVN